MTSQQLIRVTTTVASGTACCLLPLSLVLRPSTLADRSLVVESAILTSTAVYWLIVRAYRRVTPVVAPAVG